MPAMDEIKLSLSQAGPSGELSVIRVDGVVDTITASELENVIETLVSQNKFKILVDLGGVEYISSAGWGIFISRIQEIRDHEGDIKLVNMIPNVYEIYELLEFENIIPAFDSLDHGKKAFNISSSGDSQGGERTWRTDENIVPETGMSIQSAMTPGIKGKRNAGAAKQAPAQFFSSSEAVILFLVAEDPFSSIGELVEQGKEIAPKFKFSWWKVFSILRQNRLISRRSRFRLARRHHRDS